MNRPGAAPRELTPIDCQSHSVRALALVVTAWHRRAVTAHRLLRAITESVEVSMVERNGTVTVRMPLAEWSAACDEAALPEPPPLAPGPGWGKSPRRIVERTCPACGSTFTAPDWGKGFNLQAYCDSACRQRAYRRRVREARPVRQCGYCADPLPITARADARYCSTRCRVASHRAAR